MVIVDNRRVNKKTLFSDLVEGDVFAFRDDIVMKVFQENEYNAVILNRAVFVHFDDCQRITKLCGKFVVDQ